MRKPRLTRAVQIRVSDEVYAGLTVIVESNETSHSTEARRALEQYLASYRDAQGETLLEAALRHQLGQHRGAWTGPDAVEAFGRPLDELGKQKPKGEAR